jgi:hypothetical protein
MVEVNPGIRAANLGAPAAGAASPGDYLLAANAYVAMFAA